MKIFVNDNLIGSTDVTLSQMKGKFNIRDENILEKYEPSEIDNYLYTVVVHDPDAPKPEYIHYMVVNARTKNLNDGNVIFDYYPPQRVGHRYIVSIYSQNGRIDYKGIDNGDREGFDMDNFTEHNMLNLHDETVLKTRDERDGRDGSLRLPKVSKGESSNNNIYNKNAYSKSDMNNNIRDSKNPVNYGRAESIRGDFRDIGSALEEDDDDYSDDEDNYQHHRHSGYGRYGGRHHRSYGGYGGRFYGGGVGFIPIPIPVPYNPYYDPYGYWNKSDDGMISSSGNYLPVYDKDGDKNYYRTRRNNYDKDYGGRVAHHHHHDIPESDDENYHDYFDDRHSHDEHPDEYYDPYRASGRSYELSRYKDYHTYYDSDNYNKDGYNIMSEYDRDYMNEYDRDYMNEYDRDSRRDYMSEYDRDNYRYDAESNDHTVIVHEHDDYDDLPLTEVVEPTYYYDDYDPLFTDEHYHVDTIHDDIHHEDVIGIVPYDEHFVHDIHHHDYYGFDKEAEHKKHVEEIPFKSDSDLSEEEEKYCRCVLEVEDKGSAVNSYTVCNKSTGGSNKKCGGAFDFEKMSDRFLRSYISSRKIKIGDTANRRAMLDAINNWKEGRKP